MENKKKRSPIMIIGFAILIGFLIIALLKGTIHPSSVVAAKVGLAPDTLLTAGLLEVRSISVGGALGRVQDHRGCRRPDSYRLILLIRFQQHLSSSFSYKSPRCFFPLIQTPLLAREWCVFLRCADGRFPSLAD